MSYESMTKEDVRCDFPSCPRDFDTREGALNALVRDGRILAFCAEHSNRLLEEGVGLKNIRDIQRERQAVKDADERAKMQSAQDLRERAFIQSLKG